MDPAWCVKRGFDQSGDIHETGGMLPATGLISPDESPEDSRIPNLIVFFLNRRKVQASGWNNEFERPIYFLETRQGYVCCWCSLNDNQLILHPHPSSPCNPETFAHPDEIEVIGQVVGVAMRLDQGKRRHTHA